MTTDQLYHLGNLYLSKEHLRYERYNSKDLVNVDVRQLYNKCFLSVKKQKFKPLNQI